MYLEATNFLAGGWFMFFATMAYRNKDYKFSCIVASIAALMLFVPTQFFIDYHNFFFPSR